MKIADLDFDRKNKRKSAPSDRIEMVKELFQLILNREPSSRELSFYKYGVQEKEEIIDKLLNDKEHEQLLEKAKDFPELEDRTKEAEHKVLQLKQKTKDMKEELVQTKDLLDEKNREIAILRREKNDPYNFTHADALKYIKSLTEIKRTNANTEVQQINGDTHYTTLNSSEKERKRNFLDKVYDLIRPN